MNRAILCLLAAIIVLILLTPQAQMQYTVETIEAEPLSYRIRVHGRQPFKTRVYQCVLTGTAQSLAMEELDKLVVKHGKARTLVILTAPIEAPNGTTFVGPVEIIASFAPIPPPIGEGEIQ